MNEKEFKIPSQYDGLSADVVEELYPERVYAEPAVHAEQQARRRAVLDTIKVRDEEARKKITAEVEALASGSNKPPALTPDDLHLIQEGFMARYSAAKAQGEEALDSINIDLRKAWLNIDWKVGERFNAHGIDKGNPEMQFRSLLSFLDKGIDRSRILYTGALALDPDGPDAHDPNSAGGKAYIGGSFVLLGGPDTLITEGGIRAVIVNDAYYHAVDLLRLAYPAVKFIRADQVNEGLTELMRAAGKS